MNRTATRLAARKSRIEDRAIAAGSLPPGVVAAAIAFGICLRAWILSSPLGRADADEAGVGLMARHALHGELHVFFIGQAYGGAHESLLLGAPFAALGSSVVALKAVPVLLHALGAWLLWRVGKRTIGERSAQLGALAFWIFPAVYVWWSTKEGAFYGATLVLGLTLFLLALRYAERPSLLDAIGIGLALGAGFWASPQMAYYAVPIAVWLAFRRGRWLFASTRRLLDHGAAMLIGVVVGAAPLLVYNVLHHGESFEDPHGLNTYWSNLRGFFTTALPVALGIRRPYAYNWVLPVVGPTLYVVLLAAFAAALLFGSRTSMPLKLFVGMYPFLFAATPQWAYTVFEPRYLYFLTPMVLLLAAEGLRHVPRAGPAVLVVLAVLSVVGIASLNTWARRSPTHYDIDSIAPRDIRPVLAALEQHHVRYVFAPYRYAYRIPFESRERVIATPIEPLVVRYKPFDREVRRAAAPAYVFLAGAVGDRTFGGFVRDHDVPYRRMRAGDFATYQVETKVLPEDVPRLQNFGIH
jgi:4-amino-4-deoxy-L-arabinose transferase-like glycosyltransferase